MNHDGAFDAAFTRCPLIAILRGVRPAEVEDIGEALLDAGFTIIEIPLNSPDPLESIARLARRFADRAMIGAGTVLRVADVDRVVDVGGTLMISPNMNPDVIAATIRHGCVSIPGIATPTEAFAALDAGATTLKLFPAEAASPAILKAIRVVLPQESRIIPVGGIGTTSLATWHTAGAAGFGLGSALYAAGFTPADVKRNAEDFVRTMRQITGIL